MPTYSGNHNVEDAVLTIINDGGGEQCGYTYVQRVEAGKALDGTAFGHMARNYGRYRAKHYDAPNLKRAEWIEARNLLLAYYIEHSKELGTKHASNNRV